MTVKKELVQFSLANNTNCNFNIPLFKQNVYSINATKKYSWDITAANISCGTGNIVINSVSKSITYSPNLSGLLSALNALGYGFFCTETISGQTYLYVTDDTNVYGALVLCNATTTTTTSTTTAAPTTTTTTSTTTAAPSPTTTTTTSTTTAAPSPTTTTTTSTTTAAPTTTTTTSTTTAAPTTTTTTSTTTAAPFQNSATYYYSSVKARYEGWNSSNNACSNYTSGLSSTLYWNGSFAVNTEIYTTFTLFDVDSGVSGIYFVVLISGVPYWFTVNNWTSYDPATGTYAATINATGTCASTQGIININNTTSTSSTFISVTPDNWYTLNSGSLPLNNGQSASGTHDGFSGTLSITIGTAATPPSKINVIVNGALQACVDVTFAGVYNATVSILPSLPVIIEYVDGSC